MIITCPNCLTRYDVDPVAIGDGKSTRCSNCGHSWFQQPVATAHPDAYVQQQQRAYAQPQYQQPGYPPPPGYPGSPYPAPQQQAYAPPAPIAQPAPIPEPEPAPIPEPEPEPAQIPEPEPEPEPAPIPEPDPIPEPEPEPEPISEPEPEPAEIDDDVGLSPQELDEMFGDDDSESFQSIISPDSEGDDQSIDPDDLADPDPIPEVFTAGDDEQEPKPRNIGKIIGISCAALIVILLISVFFLKAQIVRMIPAAAGIYDMVGIGGEKFGAGLNIQNVKSSRETEKGLEVLVIRGSIKNISNVVRTVPMVQVDLFDGDEHSIQKTQAAPVKNKLEPGETVSFKARLVEPSQLARRLEVVLKKPEESQGHNEDPKAENP